MLGDEHRHRGHVKPLGLTAKAKAMPIAIRRPSPAQRKPGKMPIVFIDSPPPTVARHPLTQTDAVDIWMARWLRTPRKAIIARYGCDPRRLYEIWEGVRFPGSRDLALEALLTRYPGLVGRIDPGPHRRIPRTPHPDQLALFD